MKTVAVIIPFFQRQAGLLNRAVSSIFAQKLASDVLVKVIIADDESPVAPEPEVSALERAGFTVEIVKRPNGGPAKARNSALEAAGNPDYIAFLDSDDWWAPEHLGTAIEALEGGAGFYFANSHTDSGRTWFEETSNMDAVVAAASPAGNGIHHIDNRPFLPLLLVDCVAHTSTVVIDARQAGPLRFDEKQSHGGEDYLFWLEMVARSETSVFNLTPMGHRGRGIDLCRSAYDWSNPQCIKRMYFDLMYRKKFRERFCRTRQERQAMTQMANQLRREILYLLIRNCLAHPGVNSWTAAKLLTTDPAFWALAPANLCKLAFQKATQRTQFASAS